MIVIAMMSLYQSALWYILYASAGHLLIVGNASSVPDEDMRPQLENL